MGPQLAGTYNKEPDLGSRSGPGLRMSMAGGQRTSPPFGLQSFVWDFVDNRGFFIGSARLVSASLYVALRGLDRLLWM